MNNNIESFILSNYDCRATSNQGEYRTVCPFCGNEKRKFYFWFSIYAFKCYHCGVKGNLRWFFRQLHEGVSGLEYDSKDIDYVQEVSDKTPVKLPDDFKSFNKSTDTDLAGSYLSYLLGRGISTKTIFSLGLGYSPSLSHYIIVPIRDMLGKQVYYTSILTRRDLNKEKTYHPTFGASSTSKSDVLFNINQVARSNDLWIVEGPMDAMSFMELRLPVVALLGKTLSDRQAKIIKTAKFTTINVCLDSDALEFTMEVADKVRPLCKNVNVCVLKQGLDPNEALQQNKLSTMISELIPHTSVSSLYLKMALVNSKKGLDARRK